ncbi:hypothetical protein [Nitrosarchaeum koreense]|uniref:Uncharacterized protein n=1 Tax=Nitrosarchaeum koreense MY1 TaxID=1001994 RepID=F9CVG5_9ARCH|nr:hypothetical protein [Nitrosarchaeum koreense]EGP93267.1 hypothetical protein MY1_0500 [Nitrosarchaeum koreense MY1]
MGYGGSYPFWEKNRADSASMDAMSARSDVMKERAEKEKYQKQLENVEKVILELKLLLDKEHDKGNIQSNLFELIKEKIEQAKVK